MRNRDDNQLIVTFYDIDGRILKREYVDKCASATPPQEPSQKGKVFDKWIGKWTDVVCNEDVYASYTEILYTVRFMSKDERLLWVSNVKYGESAVPPPVVPIWEGHTFTGWDKDFSYITEDIVVYPIYDSSSVTVRFIDAAEGESVVIKTVTIEAGGNVDYFEPEHDGFEFVCWDKELTNIKIDTDITAIWKPISDVLYPVNWYVKHADSEEWVLADKRNINGDTTYENIPAPIVTVTGKTIIGWCLDPDEPSQIEYSYKISGPTNIYAIEDVKVCRINFEVLGKIVSSTEYLYGEIVNRYPDPEIEGATFTGWSPIFNTIAIEDVTYVAQIEGIDCYVTFFNYDGSELKSMTVPFGGAVDEEDVPAGFPGPEGMVFKGWSEDYDYIVKDTAIYAVWDGSFEVKFVDYDYDTNPSARVFKVIYNAKLGESIIPPVDPESTRPGYVFDGWAPDSYQNVTSDLVIYAKYDTPSGAEHTIKWLDKDDKILRVDTVTHGDPVPSEPSAPDLTNQGLEFIGWGMIIPATCISDLIFKATYQTIKCVVTVKDSYYDPSKTLFSETKDWGQTFDLLDSKVEEHYGYDLTSVVDSTDGTLTKSGNKWSTSVLRQDRTITVNYTIHTWSVKFFDYEGTLLDSQSVEHGSAAEAPEEPDHTDKGLSFKNWSVAFDNVTSDLDVVAVYEGVYHTVTFKDASGNIIGTEQILHGGNSVNMPEAPEIEGKDFDGWSPAPINVISDITCIAQYEDKTFSVKFFERDGITQIGDTQTVTYGDSATEETPAEITGYVFSKWNGGDFTNVKSDLNLVAVYIVKPITWNARPDDIRHGKVTIKRGTSQISKSDVIEGETVSITASVIADGYLFEKWSDDNTNATRNVVVVDGDDLVAIFTRQSFNVTYVDSISGQQVGDPVQVLYGDPAPGPSASIPEHEGFVFDKYDQDTTCVKSDMTVNILYKVDDSCMVSFSCSYPMDSDDPKELKTLRTTQGFSYGTRKQELRSFIDNWLGHTLDECSEVRYDTDSLPDDWILTGSYSISILGYKYKQATVRFFAAVESTFPETKEIESKTVFIPIIKNSPYTVNSYDVKHYNDIIPKENVHFPSIPEYIALGFTNLDTPILGDIDCVMRYTEIQKSVYNFYDYTGTVLLKTIKVATGAAFEVPDLNTFNIRTENPEAWEQLINNGGKQYKSTDLAKGVSNRIWKFDKWNEHEHFDGFKHIEWKDRSGYYTLTPGDRVFQDKYTATMNYFPVYEENEEENTIDDPVSKLIGWPYVSPRVEWVKELLDNWHYEIIDADNLDCKNVWADAKVNNPGSPWDCHMLRWWNADETKHFDCPIFLYSETHLNEFNVICTYDPNWKYGTHRHFKEFDCTKEDGLENFDNNGYGMEFKMYLSDYDEHYYLNSMSGTYLIGSEYLMDPYFECPERWDADRSNLHDTNIPKTNEDIEYFQDYNERHEDGLIWSGCGEFAPYYFASGGHQVDYMRQSTKKPMKFSDVYGTWTEWRDCGFSEEEMQKKYPGWKKHPEAYCDPSLSNEDKHKYAFYPQRIGRARTASKTEARSKHKDTGNVGKFNFYGLRPDQFHCVLKMSYSCEMASYGSETYSNGHGVNFKSYDVTLITDPSDSPLGDIKVGEIKGLAGYGFFIKDQTEEDKKRRQSWSATDRYRWRECDLNTDGRLYRSTIEPAGYSMPSRYRNSSKYPDPRTPHLGYNIRSSLSQLFVCIDPECPNPEDYLFGGQDKWVKIGNVWFQKLPMIDIAYKQDWYRYMNGIYDRISEGMHSSAKQCCATVQYVPDSWTYHWSGCPDRFEPINIETEYRGEEPRMESYGHIWHTDSGDDPSIGTKIGDVTRFTTYPNDRPWVRRMYKFGYLFNFGMQHFSGTVNTPKSSMAYQYNIQMFRPSGMENPGDVVTCPSVDFMRTTFNPHVLIHPYRVNANKTFVGLFRDDIFLCNRFGNKRFQYASSEGKQILPREYRLKFNNHGYNNNDGLMLGMTRYDFVSTERKAPGADGFWVCDITLDTKHKYKEGEHIIGLDNVGVLEDPQKECTCELMVDDILFHENSRGMEDELGNSIYGYCERDIRSDMVRPIDCSDTAESLVGKHDNDVGGAIYFPDNLNFINYADIKDQYTYSFWNKFKFKHPFVHLNKIYDLRHSYWVYMIYFKTIKASPLLHPIKHEGMGIIPEDTSGNQRTDISDSMFGRKNFDGTKAYNDPFACGGGFGGIYWTTLPLYNFNGIETASPLFEARWNGWYDRGWKVRIPNKREVNFPPTNVGKYYDDANKGTFNIFGYTTNTFNNGYCCNNLAWRQQDGGYNEQPYGAEVTDDKYFTEDYSYSWAEGEDYIENDELTARTIGMGGSWQCMLNSKIYYLSKNYYFIPEYQGYETPLVNYPFKKYNLKGSYEHMQTRIGVLPTEDLHRF